VAERAIEPRRRNARRTLFVFLAGSVAVHAVVLVVMPPLARDAGPPQAARLEVVILQAEPLPVAAPESAQQALPPSQPEREPVQAKASPKLQSGRPAPVLALSEPAPVVEGSFTVAPSRLSEPLSPAPDPKSQVASAAVAPPSFNAAYLSNPAPRYPLASRRAGEQGTVTLRVLVRRDGLPAQVEVEKSSGSAHLDAAALEAVRAWRFVPARQGTDAIESWVLVPVVFRLEG